MVGLNTSLSDLVNHDFAMERPADAGNNAAMGIGDRIKEARKGLKLSQDTLADMVGASQSAVGNWESELNNPRRQLIPKLAKILKVSPEWLEFGDDAPQGKKPLGPIRHLPIIGTAQAGYWAESEVHGHGYNDDTGEPELPTIPVVAEEEFPARMQYALAIDGTSLNRVLAPGSFVVCVRLEGFPSDAEMKALDGKLVHVERHKGDLFETTVKRFRFNGGRPQLWPESDDPKHQSAVPLKDSAAKTTVQIVGVIIGRYERL